MSINHGTPGGALQHYRQGDPICDPCETARRRATKAMRLDRHRGNPRITELGDDAWNIVQRTPRKQLAEATGISYSNLVSYSHAGPTARVNRRTRDRILAAGAHGFWTPVGIQRRVGALVAIGWSLASIAREAGIWESVLRKVVHRADPRFVRTEIAEAILTTYDRLAMSPQPSGRTSTRARTLASQQGWAPPFAWDNIDDPTEQPSGINPTDRRLTAATLVEESEHFLNCGMVLTEVLKRLNVRRDTLRDALARHGRQDIYRRLVESDERLASEARTWAVA